MHLLWARAEAGTAVADGGAEGDPKAPSLICPFFPAMGFRSHQGAVPWLCFISFYFPGRHLESSGQMTQAARGSGLRKRGAQMVPKAPGQTVLGEKDARSP